MSLHLPARVSAQPGAGSSDVTGPGRSGKAGPLGPGAGPLMTEYLLNTAMGGDPQQRMRKALQVGQDVDWIRAAERILSSTIAGCEWHLEDPDGETIDHEYTGHPLAVQAFDLLEQPQAQLDRAQVGVRQSRRHQIGLTSRWMGLAGNAGWYLDMRDMLGLPHAILMIRPDRLTPVCTDAGILIGWVLDKRAGYAGTPVDLDDLLLSQLQAPDMGVFGLGLVQSSMAKALNSGLIDTHFTTVLSSGGRISGILSPKEGIISDQNVYDQLVRDWRNITEQPHAARRMQIVRAPVEFVTTVQSIDDMKLIELMNENRDALLALWGVPLPMLNGQNAGSTGLNGGSSRQYDEAALWQGPVHDRLEELRETIQYGILDLWTEHMGWAPQIVFDEPTFDDESPAFVRLAQAVTAPLRNSERRELIGLDPFGDPALDNAIWVPMTITDMAMAPDLDGNVVPIAEKPLAPALIASAGQLIRAGFEPEPSLAAVGMKPIPHTGLVPITVTPEAVKAKLNGHNVIDTGARKLRARMDAKVTPKVTSAVHAALQQQADDIAAKVTKNWASISKHGGKDESQWWAGGDLMSRALTPGIAGMAEQVESHILEAFGA